MTDLKKTIGIKIRRLRKNYGLSQIQLAERINLSFQQIQKYEKGTSSISAIRIQQIADVFGIDAGFFFQDITVTDTGLEEPVAGYGPERSDNGFPIGSKVLGSEEISLLKTFRKIKNKKIRQSILLQIKGIEEIANKKD